MTLIGEVGCIPVLYFDLVKTRTVPIFLSVITIFTTEVCQESVLIKYYTLDIQVLVLVHGAYLVLTGKERCMSV